MKLLSLTKIGNLKLGIVKNGKPIQTTRILVTRPTKEGGENFQILDGFNPEGEEKVNIRLPFDDISLNFEVNYVGFLTIDGKEYISKAEDIGKDILLYPLNVEDFELDIINAGKLTEKKIVSYNMEKTGFLKCMLEGYSGLGEVFYLKTKSINTIRAINDQLKLLKALTRGALAGIPLTLKPIKKDVGEKQVLYVSISFNQDMLFDLGDYVYERENSPLDFEAFEKLYIEARTPDKIVKLSECKDKEFKVEKDTEKEIQELEKEADEAKNELNEEEEIIKNLTSEYPVPFATFLAIYNAMEQNIEEFKEFLNSGDITLQKCLLTLKNMRKK